ncbi:MAG TPA: hypothetical protein DCF68_17000 [Cyanothece sp. UBA12306]|nr:hypothetical protein [Cyanothece sp. UBA12306]
MYFIQLIDKNFFYTKSIKIVFLLSLIALIFNGKNQARARENINFLPSQLTRVNLNPNRESYPAKAKFWGLVANGVNQVGIVTLYSNSNQRLSVTIILPQNCSRIFKINQTKIIQVTYKCDKKKVDESSRYSKWIAFHNATTREVQMMAPLVKVDNPLYIRKQAFWIIQY